MHNVLFLFVFSFFGFDFIILIEMLNKDNAQQLNVYGKS